MRSGIAAINLGANSTQQTQQFTRNQSFDSLKSEQEEFAM
jgi:hypothetical protein